MPHQRCVGVLFRVLVVLPVLAVVAEPAAAQSVLRVNAQATGLENGTSWSDAFCDLQDALIVAQDGDEIWIAAGTYKPDRCSGDRTMQFQIKSGVALYGGFTGFETQRQQRDWTNNETILSGDLIGDDGPFNCSEVSNCCWEHAEPSCDNAECEALVCDARESCCSPNGTWAWDDTCVSNARWLCCGLGTGNLCDNSHRVVDASWTDSSTVINGLTVTGGYAIFFIEGITGGGVAVESGTPRIENCDLKGNYHGILQYSESHIEVVNCLARDNLGAGIFGSHGTDLTVRSSIMSGNFSGIFTSGSFTTITDSTFRDNLREGLGGGDRSSNVLVSDCVFLRNGFGGIQSSGGDYIIRDCLFADNNLTGGTGGVSIRDTAIIERCAFIGNTSQGSGALWAGASTTVRDSLFIGNSGQNGSIFLRDGVLRLRNSTIVANRGGSTGGLTVQSSKSLAIVDNVIFWGNEVHPSLPKEQQQIIVTDSSADLRINHSIVEGWTGLFGGVGNSGDDPLFVDADGADGSPGTEDDDLRLLPGSPAINTGDATLIPEEGETDFDGRPRILCDRVDIGAFELGIGDFDCNGVANLLDFVAWSACMTGPNKGPYTAGCEAFDFDADTDIDLTDFMAMQATTSLPSR